MSRWAGMMTMSTLAAMMVPIAAPTWRCARLPVEGGGGGGRLRGGRGVLHGREDPAAVHGPGAGGARGVPPLGRERGEPAVQPVEVERRADPGDAGDHVGPAQREVEPLLEVGAHGGAGGRLSCRGTSCTRTG